jgi:hypothetical protein
MFLLFSFLTVIAARSVVHKIKNRWRDVKERVSTNSSTQAQPQSLGGRKRAMAKKNTKICKKT